MLKHILINLVYFFSGLERVAEELMGRRKWKLYQDVLSARNLQTQDANGQSLSEETENWENQDQEQQQMIATAETLQRNSSATDLNVEEKSLETTNNGDKILDQQTITEIPEEDNQVRSPSEEIQESEDANSKKEDGSPAGQPSILKIKTIEEINTVSGGTETNTNSVDGENATTGAKREETILESLIKRSSTGPPRKPMPTDWKPQDKCYFCVDGELIRPSTNQTQDAPAEPPAVNIISII